MEYKKLNRSKKALVTELRNIVIAVVCIVLLIYLAVKLYGILTISSDLEKAKATLNAIVGKVGAINNGETLSYLATAPKTWYIVYYDKTVVSADKDKLMPKQCNGNSCLCLCKYSGNLEQMSQTNVYTLGRGIPDYFYYNSDNYPAFEECQSSGICQNLENVVIKNIFLYNQVGGVGSPSLGFVNWISLYQIPKVISLTKLNDLVIISSDGSSTSLSDELLNEKLKTPDGVETSFKEILMSLANNCKDTNLYGFYDSIVNKAIGDFIAKPGNSNLRISVFFVDSKEVIDPSHKITAPYFGNDKDYNLIESSKICDDNFKLYLEIQSKK